MLVDHTLRVIPGGFHPEVRQLLGVAPFIAREETTKVENDLKVSVESDAFPI